MIRAKTPLMHLYISYSPNTGKEKILIKGINTSLFFITSPSLERMDAGELKRGKSLLIKPFPISFVGEGVQE